MKPIALQDLTAQAFAPYGEVLVAPREAGKSYFDGRLANLRAGVPPSLFLTHKLPLQGNTLRVVTMERHRYSSQSFMPIGPAHWLALVAPHAASGGPDMSRAEAFLARPGQGVTFAADCWHHPMTVMQAPAQFIVFMWRDGTADDEEFVPVEPFDLDIRW
ncbi:ureidoglycolate lyase [Humitalea sp. 24SJ18S-53]|uniref:ureidoglycolate lyase n=1 Tax=Humitalea sp. 24SJ18S-53 TaxID=3422307 RepID=UPI003D67BE96